MQYTKEQIEKAIAKWQKVLETMNEEENNDMYIICYIVKGFAQWTILGNSIDNKPYKDANDALNRWNKNFGSVQKGFWSKKIKPGKSNREQAEKEAMIQCTMKNNNVDEQTATKKVEEMFS